MYKRQCLEVARAENWNIAGFCDDTRMLGTVVDGAPILGGDVYWRTTPPDDAYRFIVGIGDQAVRLRLTCALWEIGHRLATLIHPRASVSAGARIGEGSIAMAGSVIGPGTEIGMGCIVNTLAGIDHDCRIGNGAHIAPGATLCGRVHIGEACFIAAGAVVGPGVKIGREAILGAGGVALKDIPDAARALGVPAKLQ